jgi:2-C-methyl-D-erythritol 4-phosphate cytidylyltransferase
MPVFTVILLTAAPPGHAAEAGGAFVKVDGRESLLRASELFLNRDTIKQVQLVVLQDAFDDAKRRFASHLSFSGVRLLGGGPGWHDQIAAAAATLDPAATHVVIHDAARPAVPYSDIDAVLAAAEQHPAVTLITPVRAGLIAVDPAGRPLAYHQSDEFVELLSPRVVRRDLFEQMLKSRERLFAEQFHLIKGSPLNIRLSGPGDAALAKTMLKHLPAKKVKRALNPFEEAQW